MPQMTITVPANFLVRGKTTNCKVRVTGKQPKIIMKIWTNASLPADAAQIFQAGITGHEQTENIAEAEIIFGFTDPTVLQSAPNLRWIQVPAAGYEKFDNAAARALLHEKNVALTNSSSVYNEPCAQHVLAMLLALSRRLPDAHQNQNHERAWPQWEMRADTYLLNGQTALLLSYGAIARRLCEMLAPLHMNLIAVRRTPSGDEPIKIITENQLAEFLPQADHVINILPANPDTQNFMNAEKFAQTKRGAIYYTIGRGTTTEQDALVAALQSRQLSYAYVDVTNPEPLPPDHVLWTLENCYITPHTAGGHNGEQGRLAKLFVENLRRFTNGEVFLDQII